MTNLEKYNKAFCEAFETTEDKLEGLNYQGIELWDSVGHMTLVANLEDEFDIMMDTNDIIDSLLQVFPPHSQQVQPQQPCKK